MDQGIIKVLKQIFRKCLVCIIIQRMKPSCKSHKHSILDVMHILAPSLNSIESTTNTNCFKEADFIENATPSPSLVPADSEDPSTIIGSAWKTLESTLSVSGPAEHEEESEDESEVAVSKPAWSDITEYVNSLKHFLAYTPVVPSHIWSSLWNLENYILLQAQKNYKQKNIVNHRKPILEGGKKALAKTDDVEKCAFFHAMCKELTKIKDKIDENISNLEFCSCETETVAP
ncbi:hypothetical protein PR048_032963 [Dryococelus australis]|uniref:Uncharacterized protein n=1 Tax=Dryococelus australis TaxID=614101 RepID=A0ABQ9G6I8_9NEOP|nr:hypothetical protein PR048_032963 [Dryococelus australis]